MMHRFGYMFMNMDKTDESTSSYSTIIHSMKNSPFSLYNIPFYYDFISHKRMCEISAKHFLINIFYKRIRINVKMLDMNAS